ncbi:MAG: DNA-directed RNA polymerase subunit omega [Bacteroidales bacterium]|nr:DNA-directed RNA polymerase subunit omega [Bacteroidales bacterium]
MDVKKYRTTTSIVTRNISEFDKQTGNIYETIAMLSKRSNQISSELKRELVRKIEDFSSTTDTMEEVFENKEQIEIVKYYEHLPKPVLIAIQEYLNEELYYRNPEKEKKLHVVEPASTQDGADATNETVAPEQATAVSE